MKRSQSNERISKIDQGLQKDERNMQLTQLSLSLSDPDESQHSWLMLHQSIVHQGILLKVYSNLRSTKTKSTST